jgi:hypothetical protein
VLKHGKKNLQEMPEEEKDAFFSAATLDDMKPMIQIKVLQQVMQQKQQQQMMGGGGGWWWWWWSTKTQRSTKTN